MWLLSRLLLLARYSVDSNAGRWSMLAERKRESRERFLVSVSDAVSGESLAELHHSSARDGRANVTSSPLFLFLAVVLVRSGHVLRWRFDLRLPQVPREPRIEEAPWSTWRERETRIPDEPQSATFRAPLLHGRFLLPRWECFAIEGQRERYCIDISPWRRRCRPVEHSPRQLSSAISLWALLALVGFFTQAVRFTNDRRRFYRFIRWRAEVVRRIPRAHHHRRAGIIVVLFTRYQPMSDGPWYAYLQCDSSLRSKSSVNLNILATRSLKTRVPIRLCWKLQHTRGMCPHEAIYPITPERRDIDVADIDRGMFGARVRLLASRRFASATKNARPR